MAGRYASSTDVSSQKSINEIEKTVVRYGANGFQYGWHDGRAQISFVIGGRQLRFSLALPDRNAAEFRLTPSKKWERSEAEAERAYEQAIRQSYRALLLVIKAKLEAVEQGIVAADDEWLAYVVLPDDRTVGQHVQGAIDQAYATGSVPELLPSLNHDRQLPPGRSS